MQSRELVDQRTTLISVDVNAQLATIEFDNCEYEVPVSSLRRIFTAGDHVKVLLGNHREFTGYIIVVCDRELVLQDGKSDNVTLSNDMRILECSLFCILTCEIGDCSRLLCRNIQTRPYYVP